MTSPNPSRRLLAGRITGTFGLAGELKVDPTAAGRALFHKGATFAAVRAGVPDQELSVGSMREHKGKVLIRVAGYADATAATALIGLALEADEARFVAELDEDELLDIHLVGMHLVDLEGADLGEIFDVLHFPASDMLIVGPKRTYVPFVQAFVKSIDREAKRITVDLPIGLLDDSQAAVDTPSQE